MYISLNLKRMRFQHKHPHFETVANLDAIAGEFTSMGPPDCQALYNELTDQEMTLLYRNTTGQEQIPYVGDALRMVLMRLAELFPVTDADPLEAHQQAEHVERMHPKGVPEDRGYTYVRGSTLPLRIDTVLFPQPQPLTSDQAREAMLYHTKRLQDRAARLAAATPPPQPSTAPARVNAVAQRPRSGVCKAIWEALDAEYLLGEVPSRMRVKELAAQHGWNSSTASVQYAAWRKEKSLP